MSILMPHISQLLRIDSRLYAKHAGTFNTLHLFQEFKYRIVLGTIPEVVNENSGLLGIVIPGQDMFNRRQRTGNTKTAIHQYQIKTRVMLMNGATIGGKLIATGH